MELRGKTCLITGGTRGIGAALARSMAAAGANICINGRQRDQAARDVLCAAQRHGVRGQLIVADLSRPEETTRCAEEALAGLGVPDVLVHCAGAAVPGDLLSVSAGQWYAAFEVHVHAIFHLCRVLAPGMRAKGEGAIVLVSSAAGLRGCLNSLAYSVVKGALPHFTRALARELADSGIRVNCVAPGIIRTRFQDYLTPEQVENNIENRIPLHREGQPEDVADLIIALTRNDYITGETVTLDGGLTMRIA